MGVGMGGKQGEKNIKDFEVLNQRYLYKINSNSLLKHTYILKLTEGLCFPACVRKFNEQIIYPQGQEVPSNKNPVLKE